MIKLDDELLTELGLGEAPEQDRDLLRKQMYETLELRVGIRLADQMSSAQMDEFEQYLEINDEAGAFRWLETNFPSYKELVNEMFESLKTEVAEAATEILAEIERQPWRGGDSLARDYQ